MYLSKKWLDDYVLIDAAQRRFSEAMTMSGTKVEGVENPGSDISSVVAGKILSVEKHPNADKLVICKVDVGSGQPLQIVTGASNVFPGADVPVALDGSALPGGVKIKKGKLRGIESNGMLCSLGELNLTKNDFPYAIENGIFIMQEECRPGQDIREVLGLCDTVYDFEITPNRPDCLSVIGLARETAVTFGKPLNIREPQVKASAGAGKTTGVISVEVKEPALCTRYSARAVKNIKIAPSPRWMRERLRAMGVRPINNIVDITNYVMLEYGQPMHAFDYRYISGGKIIVRRAQDGETITTLDGVERKLTPEMLVIADDTKPAALAGIMGGEYSGIMDDTTSVVFESAMFDGTNIRITSKKLGLRSESSSRFEKGLDAAGTIPALMRACELVELLGAGDVCTDIIDIDNSDKNPVKINLEPDWINRFLGTSLSAEYMCDVLRSLHFEVENNVVTVPSFRNDVRHKADLAEEVARIYGYDKIATTLINAPAVQGGFNAVQKFENTVNTSLLALGLTEITTYSFISPKYYDKILMPKDSPFRKSVKILNPLGEDTSIMRTTALPSMLEVLSGNYSNRNLKASLYELATVYLPKGENELPDEKRKVIIGMYGDRIDFYTLKGAVEELLDTLGVKNYDVAADENESAFHPGRCAKLTINGETLGILGEIRAEVQANYEIGVRAYAAIIDFELLYKNHGIETVYKPLPKFPATARDIAVICDAGVPVADLEKIIRSAASKTLESLELFDVYKGNQIPEGKKSVAFSLSMRAQDRTLTDGETENVMNRIIKALNSAGASLR